MAIAKKVSQVADRELQADIQNNIRVYLLHHRLEPQEEGPPKRFTRTLRHDLYLIPNPNFRNALTWLLCGQHDYALEMLRWSSATRRHRIPRERRLCRFCTMHVESPEHASLQCMLDRETVEWRQELREAMHKERNWDIPVSLSSEEALD
ncbi:hypothetical protein K435DRAFT_870190 [Dendrothele bispora CBS 962.96]|uniref:Reverse transcriptase zinc-binding domain-containing protein n=1 Tax=Dendrothele bispora (strain CBS 962.96) TaxID=1314807 RepID=A0A4S8L7M3_DENBC|nr:hypothetical protein K435DRAFT_870190 [Dendrothele bispora CBS 962.96]